MRRSSQSVGVTERDGDGIRSETSMGLANSLSYFVEGASALLNSGRVASLLRTDPMDGGRLTAFGAAIFDGAFGGNGGRGATCSPLAASLAADMGGRGGSAWALITLGLTNGDGIFGEFSVNFVMSIGFRSAGPLPSPMTFDSEVGIFDLFFSF